MALRAHREDIKTAICKLKLSVRCPGTAVGSGLIWDSINVNSRISNEIMAYLLSPSVNWLPEPVMVCDGLW